MSKILVIEDDLQQADIIESWLKHEHHVVDLAFTVADGQALIDTYKYDAIVLDWGLPDGTGLELCRRFRDAGGVTPILMLTGRDKLVHKEEGLDSGADDYLTKPFEVRELSARLRALMRRPALCSGTILKHGDLEIDTARHELKKNGQPVKLYPQEFALLELLMRNPERVFPTDEVIDRVWKSEASASAETVRTSVRRLRLSIDDKEHPSYIENVHGVGYKLRQ